MFDAIFVQRWSWYVGGLAIGGFVLFLAMLGRQRLGVSSAFEEACAAVTDREKRSSWRLPFIVGIVFGGLISKAIAGDWVATTSMGAFDALMAGPVWLRASVFLGGGVLVGFGTRLAGGCTSGHGIVGMAQLSRASLVATASFMAAGFATTFVFWGIFAQ
jgi:uncharacterized protein